MKVVEVSLALFGVVMLCAGVIVAIGSLLGRLQGNGGLGFGGLLLAGAASWGLIRLFKRRDLGPIRRVAGPWILALSVAAIPLGLSDSRSTLGKLGMVAFALGLAALAILDLLGTRETPNR